MTSVIGDNYSADCFQTQNGLKHQEQTFRSILNTQNTYAPLIVDTLNWLPF